MYYYEGELFGSQSGEQFNQEADIRLLESLLNEESFQLLDSRDYPIVVYGEKGATLAGATVVSNEPVLFVNSFFLEDLMGDPEEGKIRLEHVLFHEFVHIEQIESKRLEIGSGTGIVIWEGKEFELCTNSKTLEYFEQPWEKEAYTRELQYTVDKGMIPSFEEGWEALLAQFK